MKRYMLALGVLIATLLPACCVFNNVRHPEERLTLPEVLERETVALDHWVVVRGLDEDGDPIYEEDVDPEVEPQAELKAYCSGVWISNDAFVTAHHCVADAGRPKDEVTIAQLLKALIGLPSDWDPTGQPCTFSMFGEVQNDKGVKIRAAHKGTVLAVDEDHDLALVKADKDELELIRKHPWVKSIARNVHVGDDVHIVGHTVGMWWTYTRGWVSQFRPEMLNASEKPVDSIQITAPVWYGNSGGGAFNAQGELIGISSFVKKAPSMSFFIDGNTVRLFLERQGFKR